MAHVDPARLGYVDAIKGLVIAGVIVAHAAMTYGLVGAWPYRETPMQELALPLALVFGAAVTAGMGILFLIAGLFTPGAIAHKGRRRFLTGRIRRLGLPALAYLFGVMPLLNFLGRWASGDSPAAAAAYALDRLRQLDVGPTWFLLALLLFTVIYLAYMALGRTPRRDRPLRGRDLLALAIVSGVGMAAVRLLQPATDLAPINVTVWPQDLALFWVGAAAASDGWLARVPRRAVRDGAALVLAGAIVLVSLLVLPPSAVAEVAGGWHWQSAVFSLGESMVTIGLVVCLLRLFQQIGDAPLRRYTRASFTAYLIQMPVVLMLGIGLGPSALGPAVKLPVLASLSLVTCFVLATVYEESRRGRRSRQLRVV